MAKKTDCKYYNAVVDESYGYPELVDEACMIDGGKHYDEYDCDDCKRYEKLVYEIVDDDTTGVF